MKTMQSHLVNIVATLSIAMLGLVGASSTYGGDSSAASADQEQVKGKVFKGTITAVDGAEKTVLVKGTWGSKTFHASDASKVSLEDKPEAALSDLHPGQKVEVYYQNAQGVLIASHFIQHNLVLRGYITAIDAPKRTLVLKDSRGTKNLAVAEDCRVILKDEQLGTLETLKVGHTVNVAYEPANNGLTARKIEQKAETFAGTIQAIDAGARTVKARSLMAERKFNLGDDCQIVVEGRPNASLRDLRIGDRVTFTYEETSGVLVASRLGLDSAPPTETAQAAKASSPSH